MSSKYMASGPILLVSYSPPPRSYSNQDSRIIHWYGPGARGPIGVVDQCIICYEIGDSALFLPFHRLKSNHYSPARILKVNSVIGDENVVLLTLAAVVASAMFAWDYMLTFGMEVELVWKSKWNFMKGLFIFQRYLPFIDTIGLAFYRQSDISPIFLCWPFFRSNRGKFDGRYVFEDIIREWRFVKSTCPGIDRK